MLVFSREFLGIGARRHAERIVGVAFHGDGRSGDGRRGRQSLLDIVVLLRAGSTVRRRSERMGGHHHVHEELLLRLSRASMCFMDLLACDAVMGM